MAQSNKTTRPVYDDFLTDAGWRGAAVRPVAGDASTRSYFRLSKNNQRAILMIAPPGAEAPSCPAHADEKKRAALGYNACARLAGPNLHAFIQVARALKASGFSAPEIYAADTAAGFLVIEDLGDDLLSRVVNPSNEAVLYETAVDLLITLRERAPKIAPSKHYTILDYDRLAYLIETQLLIDWYFPLKFRRKAGDEIKREYEAIFTDLFDDLSPPHIITLRDYHAENILWLPGRKEIARAGVIDFQDALKGHAAYDLSSLLEDARRDVAQPLRTQMIKYYCERVFAGERGDGEKFMYDYAILSAQRNAKILGVFARLAVRDKKPRYLDLLPRVEENFKGDLKQPGLKPLLEFFRNHIPALAP